MVCKLKLKRNSVHITPETAQRLVKLGLIVAVPIKLGRFKTTVDDDLIIWKELRA